MAIFQLPAHQGSMVIHSLQRSNLVHCARVAALLASSVEHMQLSLRPLVRLEATVLKAHLLPAYALPVGMATRPD